MVLLSVAALFGSATGMVWKAWGLRDEVGKAIAARVNPTHFDIQNRVKTVNRVAPGIDYLAQILPGQVPGKVDDTRVDLKTDVGTLDSHLEMSVLSKAGNTLDEATSTVKKGRQFFIELFRTAAGGSA